MFIKCFLLLSAANMLAAHLIPSTSQFEGRIVGGKDELIKNIPDVFVDINSTITIGPGCNGSAYNKKVIVTTGSCVVNTNNLTVTIGKSWGSTYQAKGGTVIEVTAVKVHEKYTGGEHPKYDFAILLLSEPLNLKSKGDTPSILQSKECLKAYGSDMAEEMICAAAEGKDSCRCDSGGPLISNGLPIGDVSWAEGCAHPDYSGVYCDVSLVHDWIVEEAEKIVPENKIPNL